MIKHQFKFCIHYNVYVSYTACPFQSLKSPTHFSVAFERKMPFLNKKIKCKIMFWKWWKRWSEFLSVLCHFSQR